MKKHWLLSLIVFAATAFPFTGIAATWDIQYSFNATSASQAGVETNGTHIYTALWNSATFYEYDMDGTFDHSFDIAGVSAIRDMAYDGTYFYGSPASMTLYVMDLENESLIGTIPVTCTGITGVRHIAYDPELDGGNGGFWIGDWGELGAIALNGNQIFANIYPSVGSFFGSAYDAATAGGPYLWLFSQDGGAVLHQFDIATQTFTGTTHNCSDIPGYDSGIAGGAATYIADGKLILLVDIQQTLNLIAAYELASTPNTPTNPTATPSTIWSGQKSTLAADVGAGEVVDWYTTSCGGTPVVSPVSPSATTTYYARARNTTTGGVSAACASVTVTVNALSDPTVTTQAVMDIGTSTATGNGNITDLGGPNPTEHGVCWNTTGTPTTADSVTTDGAVAATGAFTSNMTGLSPNTTYYVRAYATNTAGTSYGADVSFTTRTQAPTITDFTPTSGGPGTSVKITGTGFTGTEVKFGGTNAASFKVDSVTQITAVMGNGSTGNVTVITAGGTATSAASFTYTPPAAISVPTLNEWGMIFLSIFLIGIGCITILRRRSASF